MDDVVGLITMGIEDSVSSSEHAPKRALRQDAMKCFHVSSVLLLFLPPSQLHCQVSSEFFSFKEAGRFLRMLS